MADCVSYILKLLGKSEIVNQNDLGFGERGFRIKFGPGKKKDSFVNLEIGERLWSAEPVTGYYNRQPRG